MEQPSLPLALRKVLTEIADLEFQERFEKVFLSAARAISRLRELDLSQYETETVDESRNLQLLEEIAPHLLATITEVNSFVESVERNFPARGRLSALDPTEADKARRAADLLRTRSQFLRSSVLQLGKQLRSPGAVADRWNFLNNLQSARGRLRAGIGEMVAEAASVYAEVSKTGVIPEWDQDVQNAITLRRTVHRLAVGLRGHLQRIAEGRPVPWPELLGGLSEMMSKLTKTRTWRELRALDKREFVRFHQQVERLARDGAPSGASELALKGFVSFLELLSAVVSQRETLRSHDRACLAELTVLLDHVEEALPADPGRAKSEMQRALLVSEQLQGRDDALDNLVAKLREHATGAPEQLQALRAHAVRLLA
jgi:hypothetical protein